MVVSVHIPKTAGVTFGAYLRRVFDGAVFFDYGRDSYRLTDHALPTAEIRLRRWLKTIRPRARLRPGDRCIHGHFAATKYLDRFGTTDLVTWVRDPAERIASHYAYWRRHPDRAHSVCVKLLRERLSLMEFAGLPEMRNLQTRYVQGVPLDAFAFVGIMEDFDAMLPRLARRLGLPVLAVPARNAAPNDASGTDALSRDIRSQLVQLNAEDAALYEAARERAARERLVP